MPTSTLFTIYNASAGSGKTFTLVKNYLLLLFSSASNLAFRQILALTFTNKAVAEMKTRIIETLQKFSEAEILESDDPMFKMICDELELSAKDLHLKSKQLLENIVHNYAAFDISTIDKFNHKLIRTFAFDLKLPVNFEVELDTISILNRAVDRLIDKAGSDKALTKVLVDFAVEKADADKSWDISYDFNDIAKLLINENDIYFINQLEDKSLEDFKNLKTHLEQQLQHMSSQVVKAAQNVLDVLQNLNIDHGSFSGGYLPKHFVKLSQENFAVSFPTKWQDELLEGNTLFPKRVSADTGSAINGIQTQLIAAFSKTKIAIFEIKFLQNALKNITPLSVLSEISKSLNEIKEEEDLLLISEFNSIINTEIKIQPAPFIYERIGEKFKHYFIDEFQDTSTLQWENLIPLVSNAISGQDLKGETGSAMLVGDAKQAIYRWRGGRAEQFIDLYSGASPFFIAPETHNLPSNFRSHKAIVEFNNGFFKHLSENSFASEKHRSLYGKSHQDLQFDQDGYVNLSFLNVEEAEDKDESYCEAVHNTILQVTTQGYRLKDICIIVRRKKEGIALAEYLTDAGLAIISSETLLIQNSPKVQFINAIMRLSTQPQNEQNKLIFLDFIAGQLTSVDDKHIFLASMVSLKPDAMFESLQSYGYDFNLNAFEQLPIYEAIESVVRAFKLNETSDAYLQFYLDEVLDYSQKQHTGLHGFLEQWEVKKEKLSIVSPVGKEAVQIMTIHKSKGLEFPVVIFPYANQNLYFDMTPKTWFPVNPEKYCGFSHLYINLNKELEDYSEMGAQVYNEYRANLELDSINLLYVVLTRAVAQLHIISELDLDNKQNEKPNLYSGLFISYLKSMNRWNESQLNYEFGRAEKPSAEKPSTKNNLIAQSLISTKKEDHQLRILSNSGYLWDTKKADAIERGNLVHDIMSQIKTAEDIELAFKKFTDTGILNYEQTSLITSDVESIVEHDLLKDYFLMDATVINERDIISKSGAILRPDRLVINSKNEVVIVDYKTGLQNSRQSEQLFEYQSVLEEMGYTVTKKLLVYVNHGISVKEV